MSGEYFRPEDSIHSKSQPKRNPSLNFVRKDSLSFSVRFNLMVVQVSPEA